MTVKSWDGTLRPRLPGKAFAKAAGGPFAPAVYRVSARPDDAAAGEVVGGGERYVEFGGVAELSARPSGAHRFVGWSDGLASPSRSVAVYGDVDLVARFEEAASRGVLTYAPNKDYVNPPEEGRVFIYSSLYESL